MCDDERALRDALVAASLELVRSNLNQGTAGNISVRCAAGMLITPSGISAARTDAGMIVSLAFDAEPDSLSRPPNGSIKPSSEWRLHRDILRHRHDVGAVVHTHSLYATVLATQLRPIPALHYMIAAFGVATIRCTPYVPFGSQALSDLIVGHLGIGHGVLLGNHGAVATGCDLDQAMWRAAELETLAKMYVLASMSGTPVILSDAEIETTIARFEGYGMTAKP